VSDEAPDWGDEDVDHNRLEREAEERAHARCRDSLLRRAELGAMLRLSEANASGEPPC